MNASWPQTKTIWSLCIKTRQGTYAGDACQPHFWKNLADNGKLTREEASAIISAFIDKRMNRFASGIAAFDPAFKVDVILFAKAKRWAPKKAYKGAPIGPQEDRKDLEDGGEQKPPAQEMDQDIEEPFGESPRRGIWDGKRFKKGDRVRYIGTQYEHKGLPGKIGTVVTYADHNPGVEFDDWDRGHDCGLEDKANNRYWICDGEDALEFIADDQVVKKNEKKAGKRAEVAEDEFEKKLRELEEVHRKQKEDIEKAKKQAKQEKFDVKSIDYIKPAIFDDVCSMIKGGVQVCLVGPSGCGKSLLVREVAKVLDRGLYMESFAGGKRYAQIFGSTHLVDGKSAWVAARFLDELTKENQIVFMDEVMSADSDVLIGCNSILDRGTREFHSPNGTYTVHPSCTIVAASNVTGREYSQNYKGTQQQDASVLNRFVHVPMTYDNRVESAILAKADIEKKDADYFISQLTDLRTKINVNHISYDPSTRKLVQAIELLKLGLPSTKAFEYSFLTPLSEVERRKVGK